MKKLLASIILSVASIGAMAQDVTVDTSKMSPEQVKQLVALQDAVNTPSQAVQISTEVRKEMGEWGAMGQGIGIALISAAKELGLAANEFAGTPLGKVATVIIVYKMVGEDIIGLAFSTLVLIVGFYWGIRLMKSGVRSEYEIKQTPVLWGLWTRNVRVRGNDIRTTNDDASIAVMGGIVLAVSCLLFCAIVF
jgi:hypothetical protein